MKHILRDSNFPKPINTFKVCDFRTPTPSTGRPIIKIVGPNRRRRRDLKVITIISP